MGVREGSGAPQDADGTAVVPVGVRSAPSEAAPEGVQVRGNRAEVRGAASHRRRGGRGVANRLNTNLALADRGRGGGLPKAKAGASPVCS